MAASSPLVGIHETHDPLAGSSLRSHSGFTALDTPEDVFASGESRTPGPPAFAAPDRHAVPRARIPLTPREIAAHLLGASAHGVGVFPMLELRQFAGEIARRWVLSDLRDGEVVHCATANEVVTAVTRVLS